MDDAQVRLLREFLAGTGWVERTRDFARTMRRTTRRPNGLLLVGTPEAEPWHMTAHLAEESRLGAGVELHPTLVRWAPPPGAPAHLAVPLDRLRETRRGETLLVVAEQPSPADLLERVHDVRRGGATVLAMDGGDPELEALAHEALVLPAEPPDPVDGRPPLTFDSAEHLVSLSVGEAASGRRRGVRNRLARVLELVSGPDRL